MMLFIHRKKNISLYSKITYMSGHVQDIFHLPKLILLSCVNTIYKFSNSFINIEVLYIKLIKNVYIVFSFEVGIVVITNYIRGHVQDKKSKPFSWASINQKLGISKNHIICILNLQSTLQIYLKWFGPNERIYMQKNANFLRIFQNRPVRDQIYQDFFKIPPNGNMDTWLLLCQF